MHRVFAATLCAVASAHGLHEHDPYKNLELNRAKRDHHIEEQRKASWGGNPVICPFLKALIPKSEKWGMHVEEFTTMLQAKDSARLSEWFAADAKLNFYDVPTHNDNVQGQWVAATGREAIKEHFASELKDLEQVRPVGLYPDFGRKGGIMHVEVFARCPHAGMLFSSTWMIQVFADKSHHEHPLTEITVWKSKYQSSGGSLSAPSSSGLASKASDAMGKMVATSNCSEFVEMLDDNVVLEIADAFYHKSPEDMMHVMKNVTTVRGSKEFATFCQQYMEHQAKVVPVQFLEVSHTIEAGSSVILSGHIAMRSVFSPKMMDWAGAAHVMFSSSGKITKVQMYPTEVLHLTEKWSWKYGHGATFTTLQKLTMKAIRVSHAHPYIAGATAIMALLLFLFTVFKCVCCCCCTKCRKRRICARELETPLQPVAAQPIELQ